MTSANDLAVVEMTNTTDRGLEVILTMGGAARRVTTLAPGAAIVLVSPPGAYWSFASVAAQSGSGARPVGGTQGPHRSTQVPAAGPANGGSDADRGGEGAHRGGEGAHRGEEDEG